MINKCSITVGKTTNDFAEYYLNKEAYRRLKQHIVEEFRIKDTHRERRNINECFCIAKDISNREACEVIIIGGYL